MLCRWKLPWGLDTDLHCFPDDLAQDDLHLQGPVSFEIKQHRWLEATGLRSSHGINRLVLQGGSRDTARPSDEDDLAHDLLNRSIHELEVRLRQELLKSSSGNRAQARIRRVPEFRVCERSNVGQRLETHQRTFLQRWVMMSDSGSGFAPPLRRRSTKSFRDSSSGLPSGRG